MTVHNRFEVSDAICGVVDHYQYKGYALIAASRHQDIHQKNGEGCSVSVFDVMARRGAVEEWDAWGRPVGYQGGGLMTSLPVIDPPRRPAPEACAEYDGYRPGDECPVHGHNNWAICGHCQRHVALDNQQPGPAVNVWGYRDPEPAWDGVMTVSPEWWCPACVARFELSRDLVRCRDCGDAFHPDTEAVHGGVCDDCRAKGD